MSSSSFTSENYYRRRRNTERGTPKEKIVLSMKRPMEDAEGKFDLVAELETLTAQHCEAEAELGAVKVIDPDWCKLHEKWMLDD
ncbi:BnaA10g28650D [Brassica napus]|uniref:BnaA10g28650D protein n=1 Tax=Brassica napus TaxID=3708 RepID=A0A078J677_BRANA|nr:BnaA10g28650D [Brassica napus]